MTRKIRNTAVAVALGGTILLAPVVPASAQPVDEPPRGPCNRGTMHAHQTVPHRTAGNERAHQAIPHCD